MKHLKSILFKDAPSPAAALEEPPALPSVNYVQHILDCASKMNDAEIVHAARSLLAGTLSPEEYHLIPEFELRADPPLNTWRVQNERMFWDIRPGERVLDIGSGGWPFIKATHIADLHMDATTHRFEKLTRDERPFVVADINDMPYRSQAFDFLFCSHVLEHLDDPGRAIRELQRVGRRGYIEVPSRLSDVMMNFTHLECHHRWHGLRLGKTLVLVEWQDDERRTMGTNEFFNLAQSKYHNVVQKFMEKNWDMFFVGLQWSHEIPFKIIDKHGAIIDHS